MAKLTLVRGLPGSGKSTYARKLGLENHFEADMFFEKDGEYKFDPSKIKDAHEWCQSQTRAALKKGESVVVSNTFTQHWELKPYLDMAKELGAEVKVIRMTTDFGNIHGVPEAVINNMKERFEDFPGEEVI